ncbi:DNA polymerase delta, subunit 4-domain-containing protein [Scenedesmus sp. NREL 46B-D3]|nr:DNA polymerase delta, subunit 4-domain-containing protein [Scenedesmus sp. NREL 46B-D3]
MQQARITDNFRQQKSFSSGIRTDRDRKQQKAPELPGVHGEAAVTNFDIHADERLLRSFDLATQYGPCTGMTRLERWQRAETLGLNPPVQVKEMLTGPQGGQWNQCLWEGRI